MGSSVTSLNVRSWVWVATKLHLSQLQVSLDWNLWRNFLCMQINSVLFLMESSDTCLNVSSWGCAATQSHPSGLEPLLDWRFWRNWTFHKITSPLLLLESLIPSAPSGRFLCWGTDWQLWARISSPTCPALWNWAWVSLERNNRPTSGTAAGCAGWNLRSCMQLSIGKLFPNIPIIRGVLMVETGVPWCVEMQVCCEGLGETELSPLKMIHQIARKSLIWKEGNSQAQEVFLRWYRQK